MDSPTTTRISAVQQRFWFLEQLNLDASAHHAMRLVGKLDVDALCDSVRAIIRRHDVLRSSFPIQDGRPSIEIRDQIDWSMSQIDLSGVAPARREQEVRRLADEEARRPYNLQRGPLIRAMLLRVSDNDHVWLLSLHRLVADRHSLHILLEEISALYNASTSGRPAPLQQPPLQYLELAARRAAALEGETFDRLLSYWTTRLPEAPPPLHLPCEVQPDTGSWAAFRLERRLSPRLTEGLESVCSDHGCPVDIGLLAAFKTLLHRLTGRRQVLVAMPIANRDEDSSELVVGPLANVLVLGTEFASATTYSSILGQLLDTTTRAHDHRQLPFERLVQVLQPDVDPQLHPLANVAWVVAATPVAQALRLRGVSVTPITNPAQPTPFSLKLTTRRQQGGMTLQLAFQRQRFSDEWSEVLLDQLLHLTEQVAERPDCPLTDYSLVTPTCRLVLPDPTAAIEEKPQEPVGARFLELARLAPDRPAVRRGGQEWTYAELADAASTLASTLLAEGLVPGDVVAVEARMSFGTVVAMTAVPLAGGVLMTVDPLHPAERRRQLLALARAAWLLRVGDSEGDEESLSAARVLELDSETGLPPPDLLSRAPGRAHDLPEVCGDDPAYVAFTSGTTGHPKAVRGLHKGLSHTVLWQGARFRIGPGDRCAQLAAMSFDTVLRETFLPLTVGASLHLRPDDRSYAADDIMPWLDSEGITVLNTVPAVIQMWLNSAPEGCSLSALRWLFLVGEPLPGAVVGRWREAFPAAGAIVNLYGTTETNLAKLFFEVPRPPAPGLQPVGWPLPDTQALVLSGGERLCGRGERGEVFVRTPYLSAGYMDAPHLTAQRFVANPLRRDSADLLYRTGDLGMYLADGSLRVNGRVDHQVKIRGVRIEPDEVAATLAQHPAVAACAVVPRTANTGRLALFAFVVPNAGVEMSEHRVLEYLVARLPQAMVPARVVEVDRLPMTTAGRMDLRALAALEVDLPEARGTAVDPRAAVIGSRPEVEEVLKGLWGELVGRSEVSSHESFFAQGGDSLLATQLVSRLSAIFGVELPLRAFFDSPTVAQLADAVLSRLQSRDDRHSRPIEPERRIGDVPLSFAQQRLWFMHTLEPASNAYNLPTAFSLHGTLDLEALERSLTAIVARHESLRTVFPTVNDLPYQRVTGPVAVTVPLVDLSRLSATLRDGEARRLLERDAARPFDLERGPLLRALLLRVDDANHLLLVNLHHIVSDGWSQGILFRELSELYEAFSRGWPSPLPDLPLQYADFSQWQRRWLTGTTLDSQLDYWIANLADAAPLDLPTDHPRSSDLRTVGAFHEVLLGSELSAAVEELSRRAHTSLFMTLLAAFMAVLFRWTGRTDIVLGAPVANRNREETEGLIGFFVNNLVLRGDLSGEPTFVQLLERIRELTLGAYAHQDLPFDRLVEHLAPRRDLGRHPLFQVVFALHNVPSFDLVLPDVDVRPCELDFAPVGIDLELHCWRTDSGLRLRAVYDTQLFHLQTAASLVSSLVRILEDVTRDPGLPITDLRLRVGEETRRLVESSWSEAPYPGDTCIHRLFEEQAARTPDAIAVEYGEERLTYDELNRRTNRLAHHLQKLGVGTDSRVAICLDRSLAVVEALLATLKAGGAYVPLDPAYPRKRLAFMLEDTRSQLVLTDSAGVHNLPPSGIETLCLDQGPAPWTDGRAGNPDSDTGARDMAYVIYTSGSTGEPKGVMVEHRGLCNMITAQIQTFELGGGDRVLQFASFSFDGSVWEVLTALLSGATLVVVDRNEKLPGEPLLRVLGEKRITTAVMPPSVLATLPAAELPRLRVLGVAGEACPHHLISTWAPGRRFFNGYGPTETTVCATMAECDASDPDPVIGRPIANVKTYVLDDRLALVPAGVPGELCVGGPGLARGYLNRPQLTAERFVADSVGGEPGARLYRTGDLVRLRPNGDLEFLGRRDSQVKIRAYRVEPGEIEAVLQQHPAVRVAAVKAVDDRSGNRRLAGYVVADPVEAPEDGPPQLEETDRLEPELREHLKEHLPAFMIPSRIVFVADMPLTASGKIDRDALPKPPMQVLGRAHVPPRNPIEERLAGIWEDVLELDRVGVHDDFFDLGGESLLCVQVVSRANRHGLALTPRHVFEQPTVAGLARVIAAGDSEVGGGLESAPREMVDRALASPEDAGTSLAGNRQERRGHRAGADAGGPQTDRRDPAAADHVVVLQGRGARPPIFCVHPFGGFVLGYSALARQMPAEQPVYGIQASERTGNQDLHDNIETMARRYLAAVRTVQPQGPYRLGGWSMGGVIAYEMACQATADGDAVAVLALIDTETPEGRIPASVERQLAELERSARGSGPRFDDWAALGLEGECDQVAAQLARHDGSDSDATGSGHRLLHRRLVAQARALAGYSPDRYAGDVLLFRALERPRGEARDATLGWHGLAAGGVEVCIVPGDHWSVMRSPNVEVLARWLGEKLSGHST